MRATYLQHWHCVPGRRLIAAPLALAVAGFLFALAESAEIVGAHFGSAAVAFAALLLVALAGIDWMANRRLVTPLVEREMPGSVAVGKPFTVMLTLRHQLTWPARVILHERLPRGLVVPHMPLTIALCPGVPSQQSYTAEAVVRGDATLPGCVLRLPSRWGFWQFDRHVEVRSQARVYPDFSAVAAYTLLATDNHVSQLGIKRKARRGEGTEFHQLREYRSGDSLRQVDWKATSRRRKIISKDYSDERDQQVVLLIDSGRRMRAQDDDLSHFDHALNALLLVSYIALRQGDSVSVLSMGADTRWVPPQKGPAKSRAILNGLYDLHADTTAPDYVAAAEWLMRLQRKRSLVVMVSNCRDEDTDELTAALQLLRKRHVVLLANLREGALDAALLKPVQSLEQALEYAGVSHYLAGRDKVQQYLKSRGVLTLDCQPPELAVRLANSYLEIKRAALL